MEQEYEFVKMQDIISVFKKMSNEELREFNNAERLVQLAMVRPRLLGQLKINGLETRGRARRERFIQIEIALLQYSDVSDAFNKFKARYGVFWTIETDEESDNEETDTDNSLDSDSSYLDSDESVYPPSDLDSSGESSDNSDSDESSGESSDDMESDNETSAERASRLALEGWIKYEDDWLEDQRMTRESWQRRFIEDSEPARGYGLMKIKLNQDSWTSNEEDLHWFWNDLAFDGCFQKLWWSDKQLPSIPDPINQLANLYTDDYEMHIKNEPMDISIKNETGEVKTEPKELSSYEQLKLMVYGEEREYSDDSELDEF